MIIKVLQIFLLSLSIIGTALVFFNSPFTNSRTYLYNKSEMPTIIKRDLKKKRLAIIGFGFILLSYLLQTILVFAC
jgi:hypothetical protein